MKQQQPLFQDRIQIRYMMLVLSTTDLPFLFSFPFLFPRKGDEGLGRWQVAGGALTDLCHRASSA